MWDKLKNKRLILASASPRRAALLGALDLDFAVRTLPDLDESYPADLNPEEVAEYIARSKAAAYLPTLEADELLLTADTVVCTEHKLLGKPQSRDEALEMLAMLSGRAHSVYTGICLAKHSGIITSAHEETRVHFAPLSAEDIAYYVDHYRPYDKAGAYGIQEWIGHRAVERISGCYYNVMGLPTALVAQVLNQI